MVYNDVLEVKTPVETFDLYNVFAKNIAKEKKCSILCVEDMNEIMSDKLFCNKQIRKCISFTPYIFNDCSARCRFCSENISREGNIAIAKKYNENYFRKLSEVLHLLEDTKLFLSLSGMEPFESPDLLESILTVFDEHVQRGGHLEKKVIYSNLSAMCIYPDRIIDLISRFGVDRIETSRHHYDEETNQRIMRFKKGQGIRYNKNYVDAVRLLKKSVDVKMVCVLQKTGVNSLSEIEKYIEWCNGIGISSIVFREFSIIGDHFDENATSNYIHDNRVDILSILQELPDVFKIQEIIKGYYYYSFSYQYNNEMQITFEVSNYEEMIKKHSGDIINKLIYYPNGELCMDWNMQQCIY